MNAASELAGTFAPEEIMSKDDYYKQWMKENTGWSDAAIGSYGDMTYKAAKFFGDKWRNTFDSSNAYQTYLDNINNRNEYKAVQSARAWDEYMSNTAYSRAFADLEKMGVNPYILLNSGSSPSTSVGSSSKPSYSTSKTGTSDSKSSTKGRDAALIMLAIARLIAAL